MKGREKKVMGGGPASLPLPPTSGVWGVADAIGSSGCDFLVDEYDNDAHQDVFLVSCEPHWRVTRVRTRNAGGNCLAFDRNGNPALFFDVGRPHARALLLYATIRPDGRLTRPRRIALLTKQQT